MTQEDQDHNFLLQVVEEVLVMDLTHVSAVCSSQFTVLEAGPGDKVGLHSLSRSPVPNSENSLSAVTS